MAADREQAARAILDEARRTRPRPSRTIWIVALGVSVVLLGALAIAWMTAGATRAAPSAATARPVPAPDRGGGSGFRVGLMIGLAAGIVLGSGIALGRRRVQPPS